MINLLPQKERDFFALKSIKKLVVVLGIVAIVSVICLIFSLLSVKFYILIEESSQNFLLQEAKIKYQSPEIVSLKNKIQKYNEEIPIALSFYENGPYLGDVLHKISEIKKPAGLHFNSIFLDGETYQDRVKVSIAGVSDNREDLLSFQKEIGLRAEIKNVYFSPNSWISPAKSNFSLTFEFYENNN